jgi:rhodanese-related sulfurtransferase
MSIDYTDYDNFDQPKIIARFVLGTMTAALLFTLAVAMPPRTAEPSYTRGVSDGCTSSACVSTQQLITIAEARRLKRRFGGHALLVDIRSAAETPAGLGVGADVQAPFMEPVNVSGMEFRIDFGDKVDNALRAAHMLHDEPVILMAPSTDRAVLAALLLQERGYSGIRVVRD